MVSAVDKISKMCVCCDQAPNSAQVVVDGQLRILRDDRFFIPGAVFLKFSTSDRNRLRMSHVRLLLNQLAVKQTGGSR